MKNDILCLQFSTVKDASDFVHTFERYRSRFAKEVSGGGASSMQNSTDIGGHRRRLTISGDNEMVEGYQSQPSPETLRRKHSSGAAASTVSTGIENAILESYSGVSRKGFAPYNPDKQNQDSMIMETVSKSSWARGADGKLTHSESNADMLFAVFDGHGEVGHTVSRGSGTTWEASYRGRPSSSPMQLRTKL